MEHLSRRTTRDVQYLFIVTDPSQRGLVAAERIASFRRELDIHIDNAGLILNRLVGEIPLPLKKRIDELDIPLLSVIPADQELAELEFQGNPVTSLSNQSSVFKAITSMMISLGFNQMPG